MIGRMRIGLALLYVIAATLVVVPLQIVAMRTGLFGQSVMPRRWHAAIVRALGLRIHVRGEMSAKRPLLIASNHVSWSDVMAIGSLFDVRFIAKSELSGWPVMGYLCRLQRTVFVERNRRRKSGEQASEIARGLKAGDAMVLFAEGTTGDGNFVLPFKSTLFGAARMAIDQGAAEQVYIQPLTVVYTRLHGMPMGRLHRSLAAWIGDTDLVPHLTGLLREGGMDVELHFGEPVVYSKATDRKQVTRLVEHRVRTMMVAALAHPAG